MIPNSAARMMKTTGDRLVRAEPKSTRIKTANVGLSMTDFFQSFTTALKINTQTQTRMPAKEVMSTKRIVTGAYIL